jgi:hypothetical protein
MRGDRETPAAEASQAPPTAAHTIHAASREGFIARYGTTDRLETSW